jgi:hypothetical protein
LDTYAKNEQTNPAGTCTVETSSLKKLRPPVKLMQVSATTGMLAHPMGGLTLPVQAVTTGESAFTENERRVKYQRKKALTASLLVRR